MTEPKLQQLKTLLHEINNLNSAAAVLQWDQTTYMPPGGAPARGRQIATLSRLAHERFANAEVGKMLDQAAKETADLPYESDEASIVRVTRRGWDQAMKIPPPPGAQFPAHT